MTKIIVGNVYSIITDTNQATIDLLYDKLAVRKPGYYFSPSFRMKKWDGYIRFFNKKNNSFPSGLLKMVLEELEGDVEIYDERETFEVEIPEKIKLYEPDADEGFIMLRDYQYDAVVNALKQARGIVNVATNGGKTEIASGIIQQLLPKLQEGQRILFVTHSKEIFHQSADRIEKRLNIKVGKVGDGIWDERLVTIMMIPTVSKYITKPSKKNIKYSKDMCAIRLIIDFLGDLLGDGQENKNTTIRAIQVLQDNEGENEQLAAEILSQIVLEEKTDKGVYKRFKQLEKALKDFEKEKMKDAVEKHEKIMRLLQSAICFIGDEVHHASSSSWYDTLMKCTNATYRFGLTGTVDKKDEINYMRLLSCMGDIVTKISNDFLIKKGYSAKPTIYLQEVSTPDLTGHNWQSAYKLGIVENEYRNKLIVDSVEEKYNEGKGCLVIVNQLKHGENIYKELVERGVECEFTHGGKSSEYREQVLKDMKKGKLKVLIATSILDEGVDVDNINCLWIGAGGKSFRQLLQRVGRGLRKKKDGSGLEVHDYLDYTNEYLTKHTLERYQYYKDERFDIRKV